MAKIVQAISTVLFVLALPVLLVTTDLRIAVNETKLYEYGFSKYEKNELSGATRLSKDEYMLVAQKLIRYFNSDAEFVDIGIYTELDITHLKDVKSLVQFDYLLQKISLSYIIAYIA